MYHETIINASQRYRCSGAAGVTKTLYKKSVPTTATGETQILLFLARRGAI